MNLFDLSPNEYMAYHYIQSRVVDSTSYTRTADLARVLNCSMATARRVVNSLIDLNLIKRVMRSVYSVEPLVISDERLALIPRVSSKANKLIDNSNPSNEVLEGGKIHQESAGVLEVRYYDDSDDVAGIGKFDPPQTKSSHKYHRTRPRSEWSMTDVGREFKLRLAQHNAANLTAAWKAPVIGVGVQAKELAAGLVGYKKRDGVTPQEAAQLLDEFFDSDYSKKIGNEVPAHKMFLHYIKVNIDNLRARTVTSSAEAEIEGQDLSAWSM